MTRQRTDRARRIVPAAPNAVYAAVVDPGQLALWLPPSGMSGHVEAFEPRPGGRFRMRLTYDLAEHAGEGKSAPGEDVVEGRFVALDPGRRVELAVAFPSDDPRLAGEMRLVFEMASQGQGTLVTITATGVPEGIGAEDHRQGLASTLDNLAAHLD